MLHSFKNVTSLLFNENYFKDTDFDIIWLINCV